MADGFGTLVSQGLRHKWIEPDERGTIMHSWILARLGWEDNQDQFLRRFARIQCYGWRPGNAEFDESVSLPSWAENNKEEILTGFIKIMNKVHPIYQKYKDDLDKIAKIYKESQSNLPDYASGQEYERAYAQMHSMYDFRKRKVYEAYIKSLLGMDGFIPPNDYIVPDVTLTITTISV